MGVETAIQLLSEAIATRAMPGAVFISGNRNGVVTEKALGNLTYAAEAPCVTTETIYDLASLTKVIVTTPLAMILCERGQLELDATVSTYVPEFSGDGKNSVLVADL